MFFPKMESALLTVIDMQERLLPAMSHGQECLEKVILLLKGAAALHLPVLVTEQYPHGLGPTVPAVASVLPEGTEVFEKVSFSCFGTETFAEAVKKRKPETLILCGVETHVCVAQTAWEALEKGMQVILISDAVASRKDPDRDAALAALRADGVRIISAEAFLFLMLRTSKNPAFKEISKLVK